MRVLAPGDNIREVASGGVYEEIRGYKRNSCKISGYKRRYEVIREEKRRGNESDCTCSE